MTMKEGRDIDDSWLNLSFWLLPGWKKITQKRTWWYPKSPERWLNSPHMWMMCSVQSKQTVHSQWSHRKNPVHGDDIKSQTERDEFTRNAAWCWGKLTSCCTESSNTLRGKNKSTAHLENEHKCSLFETKKLSRWSHENVPRTGCD